MDIDIQQVGIIANFEACFGKFSLRESPDD
jgi:hypothetical protein